MVELPGGGSGGSGAKKLRMSFSPSTGDAPRDPIDRSVDQAAKIQAEVLSPSRILIVGTLKRTGPLDPTEQRPPPGP
jgi:hypothetical protein